MVMTLSYSIRVFPYLCTNEAYSFGRVIALSRVRRTCSDSLPTVTHRVNVLGEILYRG